jgi:hypothetical protein
MILKKAYDRAVFKIRETGWPGSGSLDLFLFLTASDSTFYCLVTNIGNAKLALYMLLMKQICLFIETIFEITVLVIFYITSLQCLNFDCFFIDKLSSQNQDLEPNKQLTKPDPRRRKS